MKWMSQNAECSHLARGGQKVAIVLGMRQNPGGGNAQREEVSGRRTHLHPGNDGQVGGIFREIGFSDGDVVVGDGDKREVRLFSGSHHFADRPATIGSTGVDVDHTNPFVGIRALSQARKFDNQPFHKNACDQQGQRYENDC